MQKIVIFIYISVRCVCLFVTIWNPNYWMDLRQNCMDHPLETAVVLQKNFGGDPPQGGYYLGKTQKKKLSLIALNEIYKY